MPWVGEEGLTLCWDDELWPPRVFAMIGMNEGFMRGEGFCFCRGELGKSSRNEEIDFRGGWGDVVVLLFIEDG